MTIQLFKVGKLCVLFKTHLRQELRSLYSFFSPFLWVFFLCLMYRYIFQATYRGDIPLGSFQIGFPVFLISGVAWTRLIVFSLRFFEDALTDLRKFGLIEWVLVTPTPLGTLVSSHTLWKGFLAMVELVCMIFIAGVIIGTPVKAFLQVPVMAASFLMVLSYLGMGMMVSGILLLIRRGGFILGLIHQLSIAFGGVFFPVQMFPPALSRLTHLLPITNSLDIIRMSLIGAPISNQSHLLLDLATMSLVYLAIGFPLLTAGLSWARKNGKL